MESIAARAPSNRWPFWVWSLQFIPALLAIVLGLKRLSGGVEFQTDSRLSVVILIIGIVWTAITAAALLLPRGRLWLFRRRLELALSGSVILVGLILVDVGLNLLGVVPTVADQRAVSIAYTYSAYTNRRLVPKPIEVTGQDDIYINRRGFRGTEIEGKKKPGRIRIAFLGGSQVFDYAGGGWPAFVGANLGRRDYDVEIINGGVPGHTSTDSLTKLLTDIWSLQPDIVFVCNGWNDIKYFNRLSPEWPYRGLPPREARSWRRDWRIYPSGLDRYLSVSAIYRQFRWGIAQLLYDEEGGARRKNTRTDLTRSGDLGHRQFHLNIALAIELARRIGARPVLCKQAHMVTAAGDGKGQIEGRNYARRILNRSPAEAIAAFTIAHDVIDNLARREKVPVVDMHKALSGQQAYFVDGIHFSHAGSDAAAKLVSEALEPLLADLAGRAP